ncbi:uncharacterized protein GGS25DRAFT_502036 [Hypoxylon fragiforme]|uniref:uncharacterized protein n=1 Tax=Hypoxylon fragiforme TaxID=63214 RepID=UPI0020C6D65C|nr:uncharacterized protein GGS25DRAFT_502036 [Hypoxylon fragiforme]KAI2604792.1 hypothetical protein GGS25DRAFT_502036 [Hypoxylon fragiforme]
MAVEERVIHPSLSPTQPDLLINPRSPTLFPFPSSLHSFPFPLLLALAFDLAFLFQTLLFILQLLVGLWDYGYLLEVPTYIHTYIYLHVHMFVMLLFLSDERLLDGYISNLSLSSSSNMD